MQITDSNIKFPVKGIKGEIYRSNILKKTKKYIPQSEKNSLLSAGNTIDQIYKNLALIDIDKLCDKCLAKDEDSDYDTHSGICVLQNHIEVPYSKIGIEDYFEVFKEDSEAAWYLFFIMMKMQFSIFDAYANFDSWDEEQIFEYFSRAGLENEDFDGLLKILRNPMFKIIIKEGQKVEKPKKIKNRFLKSFILKMEKLKFIRLIEQCVINPDFCPEGIIPPTEFFGFSFTTEKISEFYPGGYEFVQNSLGINTYYSAYLNEKEAKIEFVVSNEGLLKDEAEQIVLLWDQLWDYVWDQTKNLK
jgi:hypothetical protein